MTLEEYKKLASEIVDKIDKKFSIKRDVQLTISQLVEELGELVKVANSQRLRGKKPKKKELEDEFADVFIQLGKLADTFNVDLEKAILDKIKLLKKRHNLEL